MITSQSQENLLPEFIKKAIISEIDRAIDIELEIAKENIQKRKAEILSGVMLSMTKRMRIESNSIIFDISIK